MNKLQTAVITGIFLIAIATAMTVEQQVTVNILPEDVLTINSPQPIIYESRRIAFNISSIESLAEISYINYNDRTPRFIRLCSRCDEYGFLRKRLQTVNEGENNITLTALNLSGNTNDFNVSFFVDSRKPRIIKTSPIRGFANGSFEVEFKEEKTKELILYYGNSIRNHSLDIENDCSFDGISYKCATEVDLIDFDGQEIEYVFFLQDIAGSTDKSNPINLNVDLSPPILNFFNFTAERRIITFKFNITEENFKGIKYIDFADRTPRLRNLCTRLRDEICEVRRAFNSGEQHNLTIQISDKAENMIEINEVTFVV